MNYKQTLDILYNMLPDFQKVGSEAYKPGLDRVESFNKMLMHPDMDFMTIHVAGTNGKGSVSHMLASVLQSAGYRTGLYTSPHLKDFRERIRIDGEMVCEQFVTGFTEKYIGEMEGLRMSFFEATMSMAFKYFSDKKVDIAVIEAGLGGRLDSTNIIQPIVSIITNIGLDHQTLLGETIEEIAAEKAGIIKVGTPVVIGETDHRSLPVFEKKARENDSKIILADKQYQCIDQACRDNVQIITIQHTDSGNITELRSDLLGSYQCRNVITAKSAVDVINQTGLVSITDKSFREGLRTASASTCLRGRWEILDRDPLVVCDTGHNEHGIRLIAEQIAAQDYNKLYMVIGVVNDKKLEHILPLLPTDAFYLFTQPTTPRALPAEELHSEALRYGLEGIVAGTPRQALEQALRMAKKDDMVYIGGSNFTVAEIIP